MGVAVAATVLGISSLGIFASPASPADAHRARVHSLALVPLPKKAIGKAASFLPLEPDSGAASNSKAASGSEGYFTPKMLVRLGRVIGYALDYGDDLNTRAPVGEIVSSAVEWRTAADERRAFRLAVRHDEEQVGLSVFGLPTTATRIEAPRVGAPDAAVGNTYRPPHRPPIRCVSVLIRERRIGLDVTVCGTSRTAIGRLAPTLARRLVERLHSALAGTLFGRPPRPPRLPKPGPPAHGPKPAALALRPSDLRHAKVTSAGYEQTHARSYFDLDLTRAASYAGLDQNIYLTENAATATTWAARFLFAESHTGNYWLATGRVRARNVALPPGADHARGQIVRVPLGHGRVSHDVHITLTRGPWYEAVTAFRDSPISVPEVRRLARLLEHRFNRGLGA